VVNTIAIAPSGNIWTGYTGKTSSPTRLGMSMFDGQNWEGVTGIDAAALETASDGDLWAGQGCKISRLVGNEWETIIDDCKKIYGHIQNLTITPDGDIWVAAGMSLAHFDGEIWTTHEQLALSTAVAPDGSIWIWNWTGRQGEYYMTRITDGVQTTVYTGDFFLNEMTVTPDGVLWGIEYGKLYQFEDGEWTAAPDAPPDDLHNLKLAPNGDLWVWGRSGLMRYDGETAVWDTYLFEEWTAVAPLLSIESLNVFDIAFDKDGRIWLATSQGVVRFRLFR